MMLKHGESSEVKTYVDKSLIDTKRKGMSEDEIKEWKKNEEETRRAISKNTMRNMGVSSSMKRDDNIFKFRTLLSKGEIITVASACQKMGLSRNTIISYAKEANVAIVDDKKKCIIPKTDDKEWLGKVKELYQDVEVLE